MTELQVCMELIHSSCVEWVHKQESIHSVMSNSAQRYVSGCWIEKERLPGIKYKKKKVILFLGSMNDTIIKKNNKNKAQIDSKGRPLDI